MVGVAQLAERLTVDQKVAGSRPVAHPNQSPRFQSKFSSIYFIYHFVVVSIRLFASFRWFVWALFGQGVRRH